MCFAASHHISGRISLLYLLFPFSEIALDSCEGYLDREVSAPFPLFNSDELTEDYVLVPISYLNNLGAEYMLMLNMLALYMQVYLFTVFLV